MDLSIKVQDGTTIITLKGSVLGGPDAVQLNDHLHELIDNGIKHVILDLSAVEVINSSGLGMLIGGLTTMRNAGGDLKIANASAKVATLVKVSKLQDIFPNYKSIEEAITSFQS